MPEPVLKFCERVPTCLMKILTYLIVLSVMFPIGSFGQVKSNTGRDTQKVHDQSSITTASPKEVAIKTEGVVRCDKPEKEYAFEVGDRPGHSLIISQRKCIWTKPLEVIGTHTKDGIATQFVEQMEGILHLHGFEVDTLDSGDKLTLRIMGQIAGESGPAKIAGRWGLMRGTGKLKGIKGGGGYEGQLAPDGSITFELEGEYVPPDRQAEGQNEGEERK